jgi:hypothetical protein
VVGGSIKEAADYLKTELAKWAKVVKKTGTKVECTTPPPPRSPHEKTRRSGFFHAGAWHASAHVQAAVDTRSRHRWRSPTRLTPASTTIEADVLRACPSA